MPQRFSQQRERIYQTVLESRAHPTAEMVYQQLRCRACGAVLDLETVPYDERLDRLAAAQGCVVTGHTLIFTGHCPRCAGQDGRHEYRPEEKRGNCKI